MSKRVHIVGAGLAGSEAAYFLAERGVQVVLHEKRPLIQTEAHQTAEFAELVCSNSFKSKSPTSAPGILKAELQRAGSLILKTGYECEVPAGEALAVDRDLFSQKITETLRRHPKITIVNDEVIEPVPGEITLFATGPLTSGGLFKWLQKNTGSDDLYFYDAIAPIVDASTIDMNQAFLANRWDKGEEGAYLNCPLDQTQYYEFVDSLLKAEKVMPREFESPKYFQGCQPIEAIAESGPESLRYGPMKPIGLQNPLTGTRPFAVIQLRPENQSKSAYNMVGFQTRLKYPDQKRIFHRIPGLEKVEFLRMGSIHRNTYVCGPSALRPDLSVKKQPLVYLAGQITGVEGYLESTACGLLAAVFIYQRLMGKPVTPPPVNCAMGALLKHIVASEPKNYQPMNMNFSLLDSTYFDGIGEVKKDAVRAMVATQSGLQFGAWWVTI